MHDSKNQETCQTVPLFAVYVIWCRLTDMHYVGVTRQKVTTRIRQHKKGKQQFIDKEIRRLGWNGNWDWWVVEDHVPDDQISDCEQKWVEFFDCVYPKGYNKTCGGISKLTVSDDTREIIRQNALARNLSGENNPMHGKQHTDEAKEEIRQARLGKPAWNKGLKCSPHTAEHNAKIAAAEMGEKNHFFGKHHTEEAKERNRQAHLGKPSARKGQHHTEESKALMREKALARNAAKRAAKAAAAEENLAAANTTPTNLSSLLDAVILQKGLRSEIAVA